MDQEAITATLHRLTETCQASHATFYALTKNVKNQELKNLFSLCLQQQGQFVAELETEVLRRGGLPARPGGIVGTVQRGWSRVKALLIGRDDLAALAEAKRGAGAVLKAYQQALETEVDPKLRTKLERQYWQTRDVYDRLNGLERTYRKSA